MSDPIVITGAGGFIGRHLLHHLVARGIPAIGLTRTRPPAETSAVVDWVTVASYDDYKPPAGATLVHLAEPPHISTVDAEGERHIRAMLAQSKRLLENDYGAVIYASSATVYGDEKAYPRRPNEPVDSSSKVYARSKLAVEQVVLGRGGTCARITNIYGTGMSDMSIFSDIISQLGQSAPLRIRETSPVRDYLWVGDLAAAVNAMLAKPSPGIFNVATGRAISCGDLARIVLAAAGEPDRIVEAMHPPRQSVLTLDISQTVAEFGWRPKIQLETGIELLLSEGCS